MTYPPQQPGPYGPQQPPGPYGQQPGPYGGQQPPQDPYGQPPRDPYGAPPPPDPYGQQTSYQGLGTYPTGPSEPPPPKRSNTGTIIAIVLVALLVLGGGGTAVYLLTKKKDEPSNSANNNQQTSTSQPPSDDTSPPRETTSTTEPPSKGYDSPGEAQQAYVEAYESKKFGSVVARACDAYKKKFGTDTTDLEKQLEPYEIKAATDGAPEVDGATATAKINLELTKGTETKQPKIKIKIVKESGSWKFCGEGEA